MSDEKKQSANSNQLSRTNSSLLSSIQSVSWASMVDYPNHICTTLFFGACNFHCEFCYNQELKNGKKFEFEKDIFPQLLERKKFIHHVILSGGECTIAPFFLKYVHTLYQSGFLVGIHTNGSQPDIIKKALPELSFIGMDIKNDFENYHIISRSKSGY